MKKLMLLVLIIPIFCVAQSPKIKDFKVTILSTMLSDTHIGEWGFSALIEADGKRILFDTGSREKTVLQNAKELKIDLIVENVKEGDIFLACSDGLSGPVNDEKIEDTLDKMKQMNLTEKLSTGNWRFKRAISRLERVATKFANFSEEEEE